MAFCPTYTNPQVKADFNSIVKDYGGKPLSNMEFRSKKLRAQRFGKDKFAMDAAYYMWNKHQGNMEQIFADKEGAKYRLSKPTEVYEQVEEVETTIIEQLTQEEMLYEDSMLEGYEDTEDYADFEEFMRGYESSIALTEESQNPITQNTAEEVEGLQKSNKKELSKVIKPFEVEKEINVKELLEKISLKKGTIVGKLAEVYLKHPKTLEQINSENLQEVDTEDSKGFWSYAGDISIQYRTEKHLNELLVHEVTHHFASPYINTYLRDYTDSSKYNKFPEKLKYIEDASYTFKSLNDSEIENIQKLEDIFLSVVDRYNNGEIRFSVNNPYGLTNLHEFVAEALSNSRFAADLAQLPSMYGKKTSLLKDIIDTILTFLGVTDNSLLEDVYTLFEETFIGKDSNYSFKDLVRGTPEVLWGSRKQPTTTEIKKAIGIRNNVSFATLQHIKLKIDRYNDANNTSHEINWKQNGISDSYNIELIKDFTPVNAAKKAQRKETWKLARNDAHLHGVDESISQSEVEIMEILDENRIVNEQSKIESLRKELNITYGTEMVENTMQIMDESFGLYVQNADELSRLFFLESILSGEYIIIC